MTNTILSRVPQGRGETTEWSLGAVLREECFHRVPTLRQAQGREQRRPAGREKGRNDAVPAL